MEYFECLPKSILSKITLVSSTNRRQLSDLLLSDSEFDHRACPQDVPSWFPVALIIIDKHLRYMDPNYWIVFDLDDANCIMPIFEIKTTPLAFVSLMQSGIIEKIVPSSEKHGCLMKPFSKYESEGKTFNMSISTISKHC